MAIDIDGVAVLRAIAATPEIFPGAATKINDFARKLVVGQLKPILEQVRDIYRAIGGEAFVLILDGQADSASAALVKKLDKDNPELKTASSGWCRKRLTELASGAGEPAKKPLKTPKKEPAGKKASLRPEQKEIAAWLKAKSITLDKTRALWRETGEASFTPVVVGLTEKQTRDLAKKLDKDNPDLMSAPPDQLRQRIAGLASGAAEPVFRNILEYASMKVTRTKTRTPKSK